MSQLHGCVSKWLSSKHTILEAIHRPLCGRTIHLCLCQNATFITLGYFLAHISDQEYNIRRKESVERHIALYKHTFEECYGQVTQYYTNIPQMSGTVTGSTHVGK